MLIRLEQEADREPIRQVHRSAFGGDAEGRLVDALRDGGHVRLSLVAEDHGRVFGHILFSDVCILSPAGETGALALAPLAIHPERQRQGIGTALVRHGLQGCREQGHRIVVVLGHREYYPRFGFSAKLAEPLICDYSGPYLMALELSPGALTGVSGQLIYPPPFQAI